MFDNCLLDCLTLILLLLLLWHVIAAVNDEVVNVYLHKSWVLLLLLHLFLFMVMVGICWHTLSVIRLVRCESTCLEVSWGALRWLNEVP